MPRYIPFEHKHRFAALAPEYSVDSSLQEIWKWCTRCGCLKLGRDVFSPSERQRAVLISDGEFKIRDSKK